MMKMITIKPDSPQSSGISPAPQQNMGGSMPTPEDCSGASARSRVRLAYGAPDVKDRRRLSSSFRHELRAARIGAMIVRQMGHQMMRWI